MFNKDQVLALLQMSDIGGKEDEVEETLKYAQGLGARGANVRGNNVGANIGRAAYGIASGIGQYKGMKEMPEISKSRKAGLERLAALMGSQSTGGVPLYGAGSVPANASAPMMPTGTGIGGAPAGQGIQTGYSYGLRRPRGATLGPDYEDELANG